MIILDQLDKYPKDLISKGYSEEVKYKVIADKKYFLKISPQSFTKKKELELKYISSLEKEVKFPKLIEVRYESDSIHSLYEWIDGVDFREYVTQLTDKELYQYGIQAGEFLKNIHSISIEEYSDNWKELLGYHTFVTKKRTKKENQCYTEVAQKSGKRFSYEIYYNRRNQIKTACSRICNKT